MRFGTLPGMTASSSLTSPTTGIEPIRPCVYGWSGSRKSDVDVGLLDDLARVHDRDPVAHLGDDAEVVGDEDDRRAGLVAQVAHQVEDLRLDRHVERGRRLVGDEQLGLAGEGHRDHHPLGHAARHLVRERLEAALRVGDADHPEQLERPAPRAALPFISRWMRRTSSICAPTSQTGFSDEVGCWKIMRDPVAADLAHLVGRDRQQVAAVEDDLAGLDPPGLGDEAHDRQAGHALAAARFADEAHDLAAVDVEVDAVDGPDDAVARVERRPQALDLEERPLAPLALRAPRRGRDELLDDRLVERRPEVSGGVGVGRRRCRSSVQPRIERVAQAVAEQVEAEHGEGDRDARARG